MKRRRLCWGSPLPSLLLAGGLLAGCASSGDSRDDQIKELQDRVLELQRKTAVADVEVARLRQQVAELMAKQGMGGGASNLTSGGTGASSPRVTGAPMAPDAGGSSWRPSNANGAGSGTRPPAKVAGGAAKPARPTGAVPRVEGAAGAAIDETDIEVPPSRPLRSSQAAPPAQPPPPPTIMAPPAAPGSGRGEGG